MSQRPFVVEGFNFLFSRLAEEDFYFDKIIELGSGSGGLTIFLGIYGLSYNCEIHSFDTHLERNFPLNVVSLFKFLRINFYQKDVLQDLSTVSLIRDLISTGGRVLLLCDNGNKVEEFKLYCSTLKKGDIIMAHDYMVTYKKFLSEFKGKLWDCCEILRESIEGECQKYNLVPYLENIWEPLVWACYRKES